MTHPDAHAPGCAGAPPMRPGVPYPSSGPGRFWPPAAVLLVTGAVMVWNGVSGRVVTRPAFNGGLDPASIARGDLDANALHWVSIRSADAGITVDFAPALADAAALRSIRYGIDSAVPDRVFPLPADNAVWPLPADRMGRHVVALPPGSRSIAVMLTYKDGRDTPVLLFPLAAHPP